MLLRKRIRHTCYIEVEDGERLIRAIRREQEQETPKYKELCRRFLADEEDFSEEKIKEAETLLEQMDKVF